MTNDRLNARESIDIGINVGAAIVEEGAISGIYNCACYDETGALVWEDSADNVVTYVGQNQLLAAALQGASYTVTGPYVGLIDAASYTGTAVGDTMTSHAGWTENTGYSGSRPTAAFGTPATGAISLSSTANFDITATETIEGIFMVFGSGASATAGNTGGVLLSGAAFGSGSKPVANGYTIQANYTLTL